MGRTKTDYSKTIIYKIVCKDSTIFDFYVGSTTNLVKRKNKHKTKSKNYETLIYTTIRANGGWSNWDMIPIEEYSCENSTQQHIREEHWRVELNATLNTYRAYSSEEDKKVQKTEYRSRPEIKEQEKEYRAEYLSKPENKQHIKEQMSSTYTCECGSTCWLSGKTRHEKTIKHQSFLTL